MRKLGSVFIIVVMVLFIVPCATAETLGHVQNGSGSIDFNNWSWVLSGTFDSTGPEFKSPNVLESEGNFSGGNYLDHWWKIRSSSSGYAIIEGIVTAWPMVMPVEDSPGKYVIEDGRIYLDGSIYKELTFTFSGNAELKDEGVYEVTQINGELTYDASSSDIPPDEEDAGGTGGCFISGVNEFFK